jgi:uncharacterized membrane protein YkvA (DUF1232 family)
MLNIMKNLSDEHKKSFEKQIDAISSKDEIKVLNEIGPEIEKLKKILQKKKSNKIENLIHNAEFLHEILTDKEFPLLESTKKWIIFGLGYLISEIDLIPDAIPMIGYNDDALILQWVIYMIDDDINRYNVFRRIKSISGKNGYLKEIVQGNGDSTVILIPGFLNEPYDVDSFKQWTKKIREAEGIFSHCGIAIAEWNPGHLKEFSKTMRIVDHQLTLKPVYDFETFSSEWSQVKCEFKFIGKAIANDIRKIHNEYPEKEIIIIALNAGSFAAEEAVGELPEGFISRYYILGGATRNDNLPFDDFKKLNKVYNYFSDNDYALKFIFDNFEKENNAAGLAPIINPQIINLENINVSDEINNHFEYKYKLPDFLKL